MTATPVHTLAALHSARQRLADADRTHEVLLLSALIDRAEAVLDAAPPSMSADLAESMLATTVVGYTEAIGWAVHLIGEPRTVADLTADDFGSWVQVHSEPPVGGWLYAVHDDFHDGYPARRLLLLHENGIEGMVGVMVEYTDSNPSGYPKTMGTPVIVSASRPS
jgi:hypothetical protein